MFAIIAPDYRVPIYGPGLTILFPYPSCINCQFNSVDAVVDPTCTIIGNVPVKCLN